AAAIRGGPPGHAAGPGRAVGGAARRHYRGPCRQATEARVLSTPVLWQRHTLWRDARLGDRRPPALAVLAEYAGRDDSAAGRRRLCSVVNIRGEAELPRRARGQRHILWRVRQELQLATGDPAAGHPADSAIRFRRGSRVRSG